MTDKAYSSNAGKNSSGHVFGIGAATSHCCGGQALSHFLASDAVQYALTADNVRLGKGKSDKRQCGSVQHHIFDQRQVAAALPFIAKDFPSATLRPDYFNGSRVSVC